MNRWGKKNAKLYIVLVLCTLFVNYSFSFLLNLNELLIDSIAGQLTYEGLQEAIRLREKWQWLGYLLIPILLAIKIILISTVLYIGLFFFNKDLDYKKIFRLVTKAEFVFIVLVMIKLLWFLFQNSYSLQNIQFFYPLSALNIIGYEGLAPWFIYPFQVLNLFELAYWFLLAYLLGKELKTSMDEGFKIVASSYGPALLIWVVAVMFFTLNMS